MMERVDVALVTGCHRISKGDFTDAARVAPDIMANGLCIDYSRHGSAAWAYYSDMVPARWRADPLVIFEVEAQRVVKVPIWLPQRADYAIMKMPGQALTYVPIQVLGFLNLPDFPVYNDVVGFF
jgi:hypothetical protein